MPKLDLLFLILFLSFTSVVFSSFAPFPQPDYAGFVAVSPNLNNQNLYNFDAVNGSWIVQAAAPSNKITLAMQWVGLGLYGNIAQVGTGSGYNGSMPNYFAWRKITKSFRYFLLLLAIFGSFIILENMFCVVVYKT